MEKTLQVVYNKILLWIETGRELVQQGVSLCPQRLFKQLYNSYLPWFFTE